MTLVIIKEPETHLEFIKPSRFLSLHKKDYCKLQCGCQPHSFTRTKTRFQKYQLFGKLLSFGTHRHFPSLKMFANWLKNRQLYKLYPWNKTPKNVFPFFMETYKSFSFLK